VAITKVLRRLPVEKFHSGLTKLILQIVTVGLRSRDLASREKARKALVRLVNEISPEFLEVIFKEMKMHLLKGF
jgi:hypothetical protein